MYMESRKNGTDKPVCRGEMETGEETGNPLQYSCRENSTDRRAWQATVHGVTKIRLSD